MELINTIANAVRRVAGDARRLIQRFFPDGVPQCPSWAVGLLALLAGVLGHKLGSPATTAVLPIATLVSILYVADVPLVYHGLKGGHLTSKVGIIAITVTAFLIGHWWPMVVATAVPSSALWGIERLLIPRKEDKR